MDTTPLTEAVRRRESAARAERAARTSYDRAVRGSTFDDPKDDPYVLASAEALERAGDALDMAARLVEVQLGDGPIVLSAEEATPQSRRALRAALDRRGAGEALTEAVARVLEALEAGRIVRIEVL